MAPWLLAENKEERATCVGESNPANFLVFARYIRLLSEPFTLSRISSHRSGSPAMHHFRHALVMSAVLPTVAAFCGQPSAKSPAPQQVEQLLARRPQQAFAPMWMPVPRFFKGDSEIPVPTPAYAPIWQPEWQCALELTAEQTHKLQTIYDQAMADARRRAEEFRQLPPEEQQARIQALAGKPAPADEVRQQIENVLTPQQARALKDYSFPEYAVGLLYDARVRQEIGFDAQQEQRLRQVVRERLPQFQRIYLTRAEQLWEILDESQRARAADLVQQQGPTSAAISIATEVGFDIEAIGFCYPMLTEAAVRDRLGLNAEQQAQLAALIADSAALRAPGVPAAEQVDAAAQEQQRVAAILKPDQMTKLDELDFHRKVVLALGYREKRQSLGISEAQEAARSTIEKQTHNQLYRIDREMLGKGLAILTPAQRELLRMKTERSIYQTNENLNEPVRQGH